MGLSHAFGPRDVLEDIDLVVPAGRMVALVESSGSGKSTLMHLWGGPADRARRPHRQPLWAVKAQILVCKI